MKTKKQRGEELREACENVPTGIQPRDLIEYIQDHEEEFSPIENWLASNYKMSLLLNDMYELTQTLINKEDSHD